MVELRLSYEELGRRLGIKPEAARQRAKRRQRQGRWRIALDNAGRAVVHVDEDDLADEPTARSTDDRENVRPITHERSADHRPDDRDELAAELRARIQALEVEREALIEAGDHLVDQLGEARERAARIEGELAGLQAKAMAEVEAKELVLAELRQVLEHERARGDRLEAELRRPWWRRLIGGA